MNLLMTLRIKLHTFLTRFRKNPQPQFINPYRKPQPVVKFRNPYAKPETKRKESPFISNVKEVVVGDYCWITRKTNEIIEERKERERKAQVDKEAYELFMEPFRERKE